MKRTLLLSAMVGLASLSFGQTPLTKTAQKTTSVKINATVGLALEGSVVDIAYNPATDLGTTSVPYRIISNVPYFVSVGPITKPNGLTSSAIYTATLSTTSGPGGPDETGLLTISVSGIGLRSAAKTYVNGQVTITISES